jgi:hypothetical protein
MAGAVAYLQEAGVDPNSAVSGVAEAGLELAAVPSLSTLGASRHAQLRLRRTLGSLLFDFDARFTSLPFQVGSLARSALRCSEANGADEFASFRQPSPCW